MCWATSRIYRCVGECLHRDPFDIAEKYDKDSFLAIDYLGTSRLPALFALKSRFDTLFDRLGFFPTHLTDRVVQAASRPFPSHLPPRLTDYRDKYEHHLMPKVTVGNIDETRALLSSYFAKATGGYFECTDGEGKKAFLHRFAAAGAAVRYRAVHEKELEDIDALDIALRRNNRDWIETLPADVEETISIEPYYGHLLCHVLHQDHIVKKGNDCLEVEHKMWALLDQRGAEHPAEHNVGHLYYAKPQLAAFYQQPDPYNCFNPGIGQTSKFAKYREAVV
jgi:D-lactate dehydrogenase